MIDHAQIINRCSDKAENVGWAALTDIERVIVLVSWVNFEVDLGGLNTFYYNSAGNRAVETAAALDEVGACKAAAAIRAANAIFPGGAPPSDWGLRCDALRMLEEPAGRWDSLQGAYYEDERYVFDNLCSYIEKHAGELMEHSQRDKGNF